MDIDTPTSPVPSWRITPTNNPLNPISSSLSASTPNKKSPLIILCSILLILTSLGQVLSSYLFLGVTLALSFVFNQNSILVPFQLLHTFPVFGIVSISFSILGLLLFYAALKNNTGSPAGLKQVAGYLVIFTLASLAISYYLSQFGQDLAKLSSKYGTTLPSSQLAFFFNYPLVLICILLLVFFHKKYTQNDSGLSKLPKLFLALFLLIFTLPILIVNGYGFYKAYFPDYGYSQLQKQVSHKIYLPTAFPPQMQIVTKFHQLDEEFLDGKTAIETSIAYSLTVNELTNPHTTSSPIIMGQVQVDQNYRLDTFIKTISNKSKTSRIPANLKTSYVKDSAFFSLVIDKETTLRYLIILTTDNILIYFTGFGHPDSNYLTLANSLQ